MTRDTDPPALLREACGWLWAAERHIANTVDLQAGLVAGEARDILTDVTPPPPPPVDDREPTPLAVVLPHVLTTLSAAGGSAEVSVEERLRIARAVRALTRRRSG